MVGNIANKEIETKGDKLIDLSMKIWENPEIAYNEYQASKWTAELLREEGFEIETNYAGLETAIKATWGSGKPVIGFLGEYDALPGMSQKATATKEPVEEGAPGQACGHNLLGVAHVGAAIGMKKEMEEKNLPGTIIFYGCPAEETLTGKVFMARGGAFQESDMFMAWHPAVRNQVSIGRVSGMNTAKFHFKGKTAHAGADPHNGRSALDSVELMNIGANYLREHVTDDVRIHYVITDGGQAPNIVPDKASVWYFVRAFDRENVEAVYERLVNVAKGAALMNGTEVEIEFLGGCYNTLQNKELASLIHETMTELELPTYTEEELKFAEELNKTSANYDSLRASGVVPEGLHMHDEVDPIVNVDVNGSTDVGDVMHIAPGVFFNTATWNLGAAGHSWHNASGSGSSIGMKGMLYASKVMATAGIKVLEDPTILEKAKAEFDEAMSGRNYVNPIPDHVPVPTYEG